MHYRVPTKIYSLSNTMKPTFSILMSELLVNLMYVEKVLGSKHKDYYDKACTMHIYYYVVGTVAKG